MGSSVNLWRCPPLVFCRPSATGKRFSFLAQFLVALCASKWEEGNDSLKSVVRSEKLSCFRLRYSDLKCSDSVDCSFGNFEFTEQITSPRKLMVSARYKHFFKFHVTPTLCSSVKKSWRWSRLLWRFQINDYMAWIVENLLPLYSGEDKDRRRLEGGRVVP